MKNDQNGISKQPLIVTKFISNISQKKKGIVGMAKSGQSAFNLLKSITKCPSNIATFDDNPQLAKFSDPQIFLSEFNPDYLIVSPGYPLSKEWIQTSIRKRVSVINEITLASYFLDKEKLVAITGSVGKSTTVALLEAGLESMGVRSFVGGNYGTPFCDYLYKIIVEQKARAEWVVLELSSYHLERLENIRFDCSAITSLTSNHLERYHNKEEYYQVKFNIFNFTKGPVFLNGHGGELLEFSRKHPHPNQIVIDRNENRFQSRNLSTCKLVGTHNQDNLAMAFGIAENCGWGVEFEKAMREFPGLPHRMENLGLIEKRLFINDSKATTIDSVKTAINSILPLCQEASRIIVLLGGRDKNLPWSELSFLTKSKNIIPLVFGECRDIVAEKIELQSSKFEKLNGAIEKACFISRSGDIILLSPGGSSLDEFQNFEARGNFFKNAVWSFSKNLKP